jgi:hypothetical protein
MTQKDQEQNQSKPMSIYLCLESALSAANWIADSDVAAIALARRLATLLDYCFDTGEIRDVPAIAGKYIIVLQQLHLTVDKRVAGKQGEENDGTQHVGDYLRLISTTDRKQVSGTTKRGTVSK